MMAEWCELLDGSGRDISHCMTASGRISVLSSWMVTMPIDVTTATGALSAVSLYYFLHICVWLYLELSN